MMKTGLATTSALAIYNLAWTAAIPFLQQKSRFADGIGERLARRDTLGEADIWIHSASAGESYLTAEIVQHPNFTGPLRLWLTTYTRQGLEILEKTREVLLTAKPDLRIRVAFVPFDKPALMEKALSVVRPRLVVLVELELWPGLLHACKKSGCPILIVNGRLTAQSLEKFLRFSSFWASLAPDEVLAISGDDARRFSRLFPQSSIRVQPNIKFDRFTPSPAAGNKNPLAGLLDPERPLVVLASIRKEEEVLVESIIRRIIEQNPDILLLLFPRHMHRLAAWQQRLEALGPAWQVRSRLPDSRPAVKVILWDRFGELHHAYSLARAAFVGGSLAPLGGQNFLEPLNCGLVPVSGPSWSNFSWVGEEIVHQGLLVIEDNWASVTDRLLAQVAANVSRETVRRKARAYLAKNWGGTRATCERILELIKQTSDEKESVP